MSGSPLIDRHGNLVGMIQKKIDNYGYSYKKKKYD